MRNVDLENNRIEFLYNFSILYWISIRFLYNRWVSMGLGFKTKIYTILCGSIETLRILLEICYIYYKVIYIGATKKKSMDIITKL